VNAAWIAGSVKARLLVAERRLGVEGARRLAVSTSLRDALVELGRSPYRRELSPELTLPDAQRAVASTVLLELRLLAGWLPSDALGLVRTLAGWYELVNLEDRTAYLVGAPLRLPFELGSLDVAWSPASGAQSLGELRSALASSPWGDPGGETPAELSLGLRLAWARRIAADVPEALHWAAGATALLVARQLFVTGLPVDTLPLPGFRLLGSAWTVARTYERFVGSLPTQAAWALEEAAVPELLWLAEARWWRRVEQEARALLGSGVAGRSVVVGAAVLLAADARRVAAVLGAVARRGLPGVEEVLDAGA
jgi:hypothetical protein